jgi:capsular exopolysaccharide synthesis family protein
MSKLYEALLQAEKKLSKSGEGIGINNSDSEASVSSGIETVPTASTKVSNANGQEQSSLLPLSVEETVSGIEPRSQVPAYNVAKPPADFARNGFRQLRVPFREDSRLVFHTDPHGLAAEQFRVLRRTLSQTFGTTAVLMITSPGMGDGKTFTCVNLCACLADSGDRTLLVETDIRRPTVQKILGCQVESPGIEDVLAGKADPEQAIHFIQELSLHVAIVAKQPNDPSRLLNGTGLKQFLAWARGHFRWVVLDSAPIVPVADVAELLPCADAALLVIRAQSTPRELLKQAIGMLGNHPYGVIFNDATIDSNPYYQYLNNYHQRSNTRSSGLFAFLRRAP